MVKHIPTREDIFLDAWRKEMAKPISEYLEKQVLKFFPNIKVKL